jgi:hypothetical protein
MYVCNLQSLEAPITDANKPQRIYYGVYFKKDTYHKSDWEYAVMKWVPNGQQNGMWIRDSISLEMDGKRGGGRWRDIASTFDSSADQFQDGNRDRDHPALYFSKHTHSVHWDKSNDFKSTCPPRADIYSNDYRSDDFQFWSHSHLRHIDFVVPSWDYGKATNPHATFGNLCKEF